MTKNTFSLDFSYRSCGYTGLSLAPIRTQTQRKSENAKLRDYNTLYIILNYYLSYTDDNVNILCGFY